MSAGPSCESVRHEHQCAIISKAAFWTYRDHAGDVQEQGSACIIDENKSYAASFCHPAFCGQRQRPGSVHTATPLRQRVSWRVSKLGGSTRAKTADMRKVVLGSAMEPASKLGLVRETIGRKKWILRAAGVGVSSLCLACLVSARSREVTVLASRPRNAAQRCVLWISSLAYSSSG